MLNFTYVEFPCTVDLNTLKAYLVSGRTLLPQIHGKSVHQLDVAEASNCESSSASPLPPSPKSLRHLVLDALIANWEERPVYQELLRQADRNYILSHLDVNLPLKTLSAHIAEDFFWRKSYQHRWRVPRQATTTATATKPWINIYMERHLQEFVESLATADYEQEAVQQELDTCAVYINHLEIDFLQPSMGGERTGDHIPLDFILGGLLELRKLRLAYSTKTVGGQFYLGSNTMSHRDVLCLARGLSRSHELVDFCLHSTKLEPYQLGFIARSLDKGCHHLTRLTLMHCALGDEGIRHFLEACNVDSFAKLTHLDLTNNKITAEGAFLLSRILHGLSLEHLSLRLNPIRSDGGAAVLTMLQPLPLRVLDLGACYMSASITKIFMQLIVQNATIHELDMSNNDLGSDFGKHLYKVIGFNKTLLRMDLRNTGISLEDRNRFRQILAQNMQDAPRTKRTTVSFRN